MADDAVSKVSLREEVGWGGSRQKKWQVQGKRAVVHVEPGAYLFLTALARLCRRSNQDMCSQVFAAGLEALTGFSIAELSHREFSAPVRLAQPLAKVMTHEQVREVAQMFTLLSREGEGLEEDPEFQ